jgi:hypothetical protein
MRSRPKSRKKAPIRIARVEVSVLKSAHGQRGDQAGGRVRADDQQARRAEECVGNQRRDDGVEPRDGWHADNSGIGHPLRYHDSPDGEAGQTVWQQPLLPVGGKPAEDGK